MDGHLDYHARMGPRVNSASMDSVPPRWTMPADALMDSVPPRWTASGGIGSLIRRSASPKTLFAAAAATTGIEDQSSVHLQLAAVRGGELWRSSRTSANFSTLALYRRRLKGGGASSGAARPATDECRRRELKGGGAKAAGGGGGADPCGDGGQAAYDTEEACNPTVTSVAQCETDGATCQYFDENINSDLMGFDNIALSCLLILQTVTFDTWTDAMYALMDSFSPLVVVYFILIVMLGALPPPPPYPRTCTCACSVTCRVQPVHSPASELGPWRAHLHRLHTSCTPASQAGSLWCNSSWLSSLKNSSKHSRCDAPLVHGPGSRPFSRSATPSSLHAHRTSPYRCVATAGGGEIGHGGEAIACQRGKGRRRCRR